MGGALGAGDLGVEKAQSLPLHCHSLVAKMDKQTAQRLRNVRVLGLSEKQLRTCKDLGSYPE